VLAFPLYYLRWALRTWDHELTGPRSGLCAAQVAALTQDAL
jgi:hypothetical protein